MIMKKIKEMRERNGEKEVWRICEERGWIREKKLGSKLMGMKEIRSKDNKKEGKKVEIESWKKGNRSKEGKVEREEKGKIEGKRNLSLEMGERRKKKIDKIVENEDLNEDWEMKRRRREKGWIEKIGDEIGKEEKEKKGKGKESEIKLERIEIEKEGIKIEEINKKIDIREKKENKRMKEKRGREKGGEMRKINEKNWDEKDERVERVIKIKKKGKVKKIWKGGGNIIGRVEGNID